MTTEAAPWLVLSFLWLLLAVYLGVGLRYGISLPRAPKMLTLGIVAVGLTVVGAFVAAVQRDGIGLVIRGVAALALVLILLGVWLKDR